ncbi:hypothetical protein [Microbacterium gorillae]|uniref:hypothetical protein n=1 Tax=Microbacterium gorillae TaxID=1231063 RepID=UPI00114325DB|nr:hypothetical protein [Microbacterium gorillae]
MLSDEDRLRLRALQRRRFGTADNGLSAAEAAELDRLTARARAAAPTASAASPAEGGTSARDDEASTTTTSNRSGRRPWVTSVVGGILLVALGTAGGWGAHAALSAQTVPIVSDGVATVFAKVDALRNWDEGSPQIVGIIDDTVYLAGTHSNGRVRCLTTGLPDIPSVPIQPLECRAKDDPTPLTETVRAANSAGSQTMTYEITWDDGRAVMSPVPPVTETTTGTTTDVLAADLELITGLTEPRTGSPTLLANLDGARVWAFVTDDGQKPTRCAILIVDHPGDTEPGALAMWTEPEEDAKLTTGPLRTADGIVLSTAPLVVSFANGVPEMVSGGAG